MSKYVTKAKDGPRAPVGVPAMAWKADVPESVTDPHALRRTIVSSSALMLMSQGFQLLLNVTSIAVLARALSPEDFGLTAMVTAVMGFLRVFSDAGLSAATVQRAEVSRKQVSALFWINVAIGGAATLLLAAGAPLLAQLYGEPRVVRIALLLSVTFLVAASSVQHLALLKREMRFEAIALTQVISVSVGTATGIAFAWASWGYWSLVAMQLTSTSVNCLMTWRLSGWVPSAPAVSADLAPLLRFGANLSASSFVWSLARGLDGVLIGRASGPQALGLYSRSSALIMRPIEQLMVPFESVFVPALARVQGQPERYRSIFVPAYCFVALAWFSLTAVMLALSTPLTLAVLGAEWRQASPIVACFTLLALYTPIASTISWLLTSQGRGRDVLVSTLFGSATTVASFLIGLPHGPSGVALSFSLTSVCINLPFLMFLGGRCGPVSRSALVRAFLEHLPVWLVGYAATSLTISRLEGLAPVTQVVSGGMAGLLAIASVVFVYKPYRTTATRALRLLGQWREEAASR